MVLAKEQMGFRFLTPNVTAVVLLLFQMLSLGAVWTVRTAL